MKTKQWVQVIFDTDGNQHVFEDRLLIYEEGDEIPQGKSPGDWVTPPEFEGVTTLEVVDAETGSSKVDEVHELEMDPDENRKEPRKAQELAGKIERDGNGGVKYKDSVDKRSEKRIDKQRKIQ